ncbi:winged helix-turn-helix domain-containing protein [Neorhizobium galegae]|uniref:Winged helix-turn-helix domain-containing protein n=1 Tax=Neorhizobium galegae TaxID=399 RepID=A0A6A1TYM2_NEOGA|nr:winged helix-turn-helix domain-containing protein [Neorhizobium galegae]
MRTALSVDETTIGRELKALGFAKLSARPRHYAQNEGTARGTKRATSTSGCARRSLGLDVVSRLYRS